jgi:hypothetical protein
MGRVDSEPGDADHMPGEKVKSYPEVEGDLVGVLDQVQAFGELPENQPGFAVGQLDPGRLGFGSPKNSAHGIKWLPMVSWLGYCKSLEL